MDRAGLERAYQTALAALLAERTPEGYWIGELSTSALSTATAVGALALVLKHSSGLSLKGETRDVGLSLPPHPGPPPQGGRENRARVASKPGVRSENPDQVSPSPLKGEGRGGGASQSPPPQGGRGEDREALRALIRNGIAWLAANQNPDGGWGDTDQSFSNISTTMLCQAAFHLGAAADEHAEVLGKANAWLGQRYGWTAPEHAEAVRQRYGKDRTFAVPILTMCALAGLVEWREVPSLPFELACFPQSWFRFLQLPVVSYALPALIAIGQAVHHHRPSWNPAARIVRQLARRKSLQVLQRIQPSSGGFLEATPLTSFVTMSLASIGLAEHPVARNGVRFLVESVRPDGSWPIDTNLSTWVTTLAINALAAANELNQLPQRQALASWLVKQQFRERHPYTGAEPGGWGWTWLPGSVPDADDTPGALIALRNLALCGQNPSGVNSPPCGPLDAWLGISWLRGLQNRDHGWPTFCRGWGNLPFDRSGTDLTAHALRAFHAWSRSSFPEQRQCPPGTLPRQMMRGLDYLERNQRPDGSWLPLWFGNQHAPDDENPTYGTARVLAAYRDLDKMSSEPARRGVAWLLSVQNPDGGWGGAANTPSSIEETSLAVEVLLAAGPEAQAAVNRGLAWLVQQIEDGGLQRPTPIGFYFAKLWYYEKLYPIVFAVAALGRARRALPDLPCATPDGQQGRDRDHCR